MKREDIVLIPVRVDVRWECTDCGVIYPTKEQAAQCESAHKPSEGAGDG